MFALNVDECINHWIGICGALNTGDIMVVNEYLTQMIFDGIIVVHNVNIQVYVYFVAVVIM